MHARLRQWWPVCKVVLAVVILAAVGWHFVRILQDPHLQEVDAEHRPAWQIIQETLWHASPGWLTASALLYLAGLTFYLAFWLLLLRALGQRPVLLPAARAYFVGHLGKYVPGKAWALVLRATLSRPAGVPAGVAALTGVYETLTTMAAGALFAAVVLSWQMAAGSEHQVWLALGLLALAGVPILPGIFNPVVRRLSAPFLKGDAVPLPRLGHRTLLEGLVLGVAGWGVLGLSLWAVLRALRPELAPWAWDVWLRWAAIAALAYVAGFLALVLPGGVGVREAVLQIALKPEVGPLLSVLVPLLLRLLWTVAEVLLAAALWWLAGPAPAPEPAPELRAAPCEEGLPP
jgi:uncharacterized membrane protein YbhN (UPF0104 family)